MYRNLDIYELDRILRFRESEGAAAPGMEAMFMKVRCMIEPNIHRVGTSVNAFIAGAKDWGVDSLTSLSSRLTSWADSVPNDSSTGIFKKAFQFLGRAVAKAIEGITSLIQKISEKLAGSELLRKPLFSGTSITVGSFLGFAAISAVVMFIVYKVYKAIKKQNANKSESKRVRYARVEKAIMESMRMFDNLNYLTESMMLTEGIFDIVTNIIKKAVGLAKDFVTGIANTFTGFAKAYPTLTKILLICCGYLLAFGQFGLGATSVGAPNVSGAVSSGIAKAAKAVTTTASTAGGALMGAM